MSEEQYKKVIDALVDFVLRVATKNEATTETEIAVLPAIAYILSQIYKLISGVILFLCFKNRLVNCVVESGNLFTIFFGSRI